MKVFAYLRNPGYCENLVERDYKKIDVINFAFGKIIDGKLVHRSNACSSMCVTGPVIFIVFKTWQR